VLEKKIISENVLQNTDDLTQKKLSNPIQRKFYLEG
jgi:hypothetical protein